MKKAIILSSGVAIVTFTHESEQLEEMCIEYEKAVHKGTETKFLKENGEKEFPLSLGVHSIEYIQRAQSSNFVFTPSDLRAIKKLANEVRREDSSKTTLNERLFS